jgi:hypothetical protein
MPMISDLADAEQIMRVRAIRPLWPRLEIARVTCCDRALQLLVGEIEHSSAAEVRIIRPPKPSLQGPSPRISLGTVTNLIDSRASVLPAECLGPFSLKAIPAMAPEDSPANQN